MSAPKKPVDQAVEQAEPAAIYQRFTFLHGEAKRSTEAQFAEKTMNICQGVSTCLGLIHSSELDRDTGTPPILDATEVDRLLRFIGATADMLAVDAEKSIQRVSKEAKS